MRGVRWMDGLLAIYMYAGRCTDIDPSSDTALTHTRVGLDTHMWVWTHTRVGLDPHTCGLFVESNAWFGVLSCV